MKTPTRPALRYYGGKWNLAPWIISHFPPHKNYVEPCGGAASVLLQKPRSPLETYNDLDGNVVNFFRVLRERPDELVRKLRLTPWSRDEFEICRYEHTDPLENARRFFVSAQMGMGRGPFDKTTAPRFTTDVTDKFSMINCQFSEASTETLYEVAKRFHAVQIENRDMLEIISNYRSPNTLFYFDPPYVMSTRTGRGYSIELTEDQHILSAELLRKSSGYVVVSGYACPLYANLYEAHGWQRRDKEAQTNSGGKRMESIWLSPRTWQALETGAGLPLFSQPAAPGRPAAETVTRGGEDGSVRR